MPYLTGKGVGVINASVLSMGLLTPQGPPAWHPAPAALRAAAEKAAEGAQAAGVALPALAIAQAVKDERVSCHLVGFSSRQQVDEAVQAALWAFGSPADRPQGYDAALEAVEAALAEVKGTTWPSGRWQAP